ncbi:MAG: hypothetical protein U9N77_17110 [Thermodesulfobacteriota bacterium]|nr:hypothetical protein [Thermodesulfobacteriota bacterium]
MEDNNTKMEDNNTKAAFLGKVTASVTHELQNVLAIIKENEGLMEDIILMSQETSAAELAEKLERSLDTIKKQVLRGVNRTSELNGFAHTTDHVKAEINIFKTMDKLISLTRRITNLAGVEVTIAENAETAKNEQQPSIVTDPVLFQMAVYNCIDWLTSSAFPGTILTISFQKSNNRVSIYITGTNDRGKKIFKNNLQAVAIDHSTAQSVQWQETCDACDKINAVAKIFDDNSGLEIIFG